MSATARERMIAFRKSQPRPPRLTHRTVRARGLDFAVFTTPEVKEGPAPLLCVNGGMLYSHALLWPALAPFAERRQVILYDQRGRGASQAPPAVRSSRIEHDAGDIPALREALGIGRWDLLGHSWGGGIAMLAAARDPLGVRRLVLVDSVGATGDWLPALHPAALARLRGAQHEALEALDPATLQAGDPVLQGEYGRALYPAWFADRDLATMFAPPRHESASGAAVAARLRKDGYDWREPIAGITASTLVVHGAQDLLPVRVATELSTLISGARLVLIEDSGHMPFWEQPAEFFSAVTGFLDLPDRGR